MTTACETRLACLENELQLRRWLRLQRVFETMTANELEAFAITGVWVDRPEPEFGLSKLDSMDRARLIRLWKTSLTIYAGHSRSELDFYAIHGYWPTGRELQRNREQVSNRKESNHISRPRHSPYSLIHSSRREGVK